MSYWSAPIDRYRGERVFVVGGGPSLRDFDPERLRGRPVIAANNAGLDLMPWADVLFWADKRWFEWNADRLGSHKGEFRVTRRPAGRGDVLLMQHEPKWNLSRKQDTVAGWCSGGSCINLAFLMGSSDIVLLGFDMHGDNYHTDHRKPGNARRYIDQFMPAIERMAAPLAAYGVKVRNATPGSALQCFPSTRLDDIL